MANNAKEEALSRAIEAEVIRKANAGIPLSDTSNAAKNALYSQTVASRNAQPQPTQTTPQQTISPELIKSNLQQQGNQDIQSIQDFLLRGSQGYVDQQRAILSQARDQQIAELQANYEQAVREGELSVREAQDQFNKAVEQINEQKYLDSQYTSLSAEGMGIQNSMQMLGLQQGDNARANKATNAQMTERDSRIANIKDRLANLASTKDRDISMANANYNYGLASAQGQADMNYNNSVASMMQQVLSDTRNQNFQVDIAALQQMYQQENLTTQQKYALEQMAAQQGYDLAKMSKQHGYDLDKMGVQQGYTQDNMRLEQQFTEKNMSKQQEYTLAQMAKQYGYDLGKMSQQQQYQLAQMARQHGYNVSMENLSNSNAIARDNAKYQAEINAEVTKRQQQAEDELKEYDLAVSRELAKYTPGTKEYQIRQGQLASERQAMITEMGTKTQYDAVSQEILNGVTTRPTVPKREWYQTQKSYNKEVAEYKAKLEAYERYLKFKNDPTSVFSQ